MKLYYQPQGCWEIPGQQDRKAERVDVPTTPIALAAWLNDREVPLQPCNTADVQLTREPAEPLGERPWVRGPAAKDPPRYSTHDQAAVDAGVEFVPIDRAAAIAHSADQCPNCHSGNTAALMHVRFREEAAICQWIEKCDTLSALEAITYTVRDRLAELKVDLAEEGTVQ